MLPRSSGAPSRLAPPRQGRDLRKLILLAMGLLFVSYFVVVNVYFNLSASEAAPRENNNNNLIGDRHRAGVALVDRKPAVESFRQQEEDREEQETEDEDEAEEQEEQQAAVVNASWPVNPERKYVWLDVAIDGEPVGRVTVEVRAAFLLSCGRG
jgi:hypothetical protein